MLIYGIVLFNKYMLESKINRNVDRLFGVLIESVYNGVIDIVLFGINSGIFLLMNLIGEAVDGIGCSWIMKIYSAVFWY